MSHFVDEEYTGLSGAPEKGEYDSCLFRNCNFNEANLEGYDFYNCRFISCDLSMAKIKKTGLKEVTFENCKMMGLPFAEVNSFLLQMQFIQCQLQYCSFFALDLKETTFDQCQLIECDLQECDLHAASFRNCDLSGSNFDYAILTEADLRGAQGFQIDPELTKIKAAKFDRLGLEGLLMKYDLDIE